MTVGTTSYRTAGTLGLKNLYHYQSFNADYLREVIVDVIYFSKPSDFNDPWDCQPWFDPDCVRDPTILEEHVQWYVDVTRKHRPDIPEDHLQKTAESYRSNPDLLIAKIPEFSETMASAINARYRVYCLGPKPDCELMWAHYAAKHQGVCLEFAVRNDLFYSALEVQYAQTYPVFRMTGFSGPEEHLAPLLTKSASWNYENEFRLTADQNGNPRDTIVTVAGKKSIPAMSLTAVILGCLAPNSTKEAIADLVAASPQKPQLKTATRMKDKYHLAIS
jgi:hypothetical protein